MNEELYTRLNELPSERLLVILAFFMNQYTREAQAVLRHLGVERGLTDADIARFRHLALLPKSARYTCHDCREALDLDESDLRNGVFTCPVCNRLQLINYREIPGCAENLDFSEEDERSLSSLLSEWHEETEKVSPVGIGGWLIVLALLLTAALCYNLMMLPRAFHVIGGLGLAMNLLDIVAFGGLLLLMYRRARVFPWLCSLWLIYSAAALFLQGAGGPGWPLHDIRTYLGTGLAAIWVPYLLGASRVQQTFTQPLRPATGASRDPDPTV